MAEEIDLSETPEEKKKHVPVLARENLLRQIGVPGLFSVGYSDVGSSIYYALGVTALYALGATPLAIGIAGIFFAFTVLTYAELSAAIPEAGGVCSFSRRAFNDFMAFVAGWAILLDFIVTAAISSYSIGPYLSYFFPVLKTTAGNLVFTTAIISGLFAINVIGIKESTRMSFALIVFD
jgi:APA family basic amino acid/polyamine antiporter